MNFAEILRILADECGGGIGAALLGSDGIPIEQVQATVRDAPAGTAPDVLIVIADVHDVDTIAPFGGPPVLSHAIHVACCSIPVPPNEVQAVVSDPMSGALKPGELRRNRQQLGAALDLACRSDQDSVLGEHVCEECGIALIGCPGVLLHQVAQCIPIPGLTVHFAVQPLAFHKPPGASHAWRPVPHESSDGTHPGGASDTVCSTIHSAPHDWAG